MAKPNLPRLGEPYEIDMISPPGTSYGVVWLEDELSRLIHQGLYEFPTPIHNNRYIDAGYPAYVVDMQGGIHSAGMYLGHDGFLSADPVNQWYAGKDWMIAAGTFASHIAEFRDHYHMLRQPGTYSTGHDVAHSDESNLRNKVTMWWGRGLAGETFKQLSEWFALPPITPAGATVDEDWRLVQPTIENLMRVICDNCLGYNILRRFHKQCRPIDWNTALNSGLLTVPDFSQQEWAPHGVISNFTLLNRTARAERWDDLMEWYGKCLDWYDNNVKTDVTHRLERDSGVS